MKNKKLSILIIIIFIIVAYFIHLTILNFTCPIKGTYVYMQDETITLEFKNGKYIFSGEGESFDQLVQSYGNDQSYTLDLVHDNEPTYKPIEGTQSTYYYLNSHGEDEFPIIVSVNENGELKLRVQPLSFVDTFYLDEE